MLKRAPGVLASKSHQHSWAVVNLWFCDKFFWDYELSLDNPQSRTVSHARKLALFCRLLRRWLLNCRNSVSVLGKICQNQSVSVNCLDLILCYFLVKNVLLEIS